MHARLVVRAHVCVLHVLPAKADGAAAAELAVALVLAQEVRHDLPGYDVAHIVRARHLAESHASHLALHACRQPAGSMCCLHQALRFASGYNPKQLIHVGSFRPHAQTRSLIHVHQM